MVLSGSSDSSSSLSFSSCWATAGRRAGVSAAPGEPNPPSPPPAPGSPSHLQGLLEGRGLVLRVLGDGGVRAGALTRPDLPRARQVPVLVRRLLYLGAHLHRVLAARLHQRLGGEEAQVCKAGPSRASGQGRRAGSEGLLPPQASPPPASRSSAQPSPAPQAAGKVGPPRATLFSPAAALSRGTSRRVLRCA